MKTRIAILLCIVFAAAGAKAQTKGPLAYRVGITANLPLITAHTDSFKSRTGWGIWGEAEYYMAPRWRVQPGLAYNSFGYNQNYYNDSGAAVRRKITEHYMELTGRFMFLTAPGENSARVFLGTGISLLAGRSTDMADIVGTNITTRTQDNKKSFTPGLLLSAGFMAPLSRRIDLGLQYTHGLPAKIYPLDVTGRLGTLQISLNYKIVPDPATGKVTRPKNNSAAEAPLLYKKDSLVIVVRLNENTRRIALLQEQGYYNEAIEEKEKTREENEQVIKAFTKKFTFIPVYFIYDTDSKTALTGNFDGILLNGSLERDSTVGLPKMQYVFAEFARQFDEETNTSGMYGLVIYNEKFKNIPPPFPAFVSDAYGFLKKEEVIERFEKRLKKYFGVK